MAVKIKYQEVTTEARNALNPIQGTVVYDTDLEKYYAWTGKNWLVLENFIGGNI